MSLAASSGLEDLLTEMTANPLPGAIVLTPSDVSSVAVDELARQLQKTISGRCGSDRQPLAAKIGGDIKSGQRYWPCARSNRNSWDYSSWWGNTIKLAIENRKAEILVIKLVGGSDMYAARPFLYTGLLYGLGGGVLATLLQGIVLATFNSNLEVLMRLYESDFQLRGFGLMSSLLIIVAGATVGWTAALMASLRHIRAINP